MRFVVGDTIDVDNDTGFYIWIKQQHFRLIDIDASGMRDVERPPGLDSVEYLTDLIGGKKIIIQTIKGRDGGDSRGKYGRWLGRIYLNGMDVNQHMIDVGYEIEYAN
ncbi:MAG: thermonuclease family protein [Rhizobiaceae bacterium]|nr:thermonuclease family protein [Rhizobiaceae bacterium]